MPDATRIAVEATEQRMRSNRIGRISRQVSSSVKSDAVPPFSMDIDDGGRQLLDTGVQQGGPLKVVGGRREVDTLPGNGRKTTIRTADSPSFPAQIKETHTHLRSVNHCLTGNCVKFEKVGCFCGDLFRTRSKVKLPGFEIPTHGEFSSSKAAIWPCGMRVGPSRA